MRSAITFRADQSPSLITRLKARWRLIALVTVQLVLLAGLACGVVPLSVTRISFLAGGEGVVQEVNTCV